jgi:hypothetical protein
MPVKTRDLDTYVPLLAREFYLYPPSLVKRSKLRRIVLCSNLSISGYPAAGTVSCTAGVLYLDVSQTSRIRRHRCITIHHEFFHQLDYANDRLVRLDGEWSLLNEHGFVYGQGVQDDANPNSIALTEDYPGFLTRYSLTDVGEDQAELFAHLIVDASYVRQRADRDPILMAKILTMKRRLLAFCPDLDDTFWQSVHRVNRPGKQPMISGGGGHVNGPAHAQ